MNYKLLNVLLTLSVFCGSVKPAWPEERPVDAQELLHPEAQLAVIELNPPAVQPVNPAQIQAHVPNETMRLIVLGINVLAYGFLIYKAFTLEDPENPLINGSATESIDFIISP